MDSPENATSRRESVDQNQETKRPKPSRVSKYNIFARCWYSSDVSDRDVKTIGDEPLGELTDGERKLLDQSWDDFKGDVSMKNLINDLDKSIKRRMRLYISDNDEENLRIKSFRK